MCHAGMIWGIKNWPIIQWWKTRIKSRRTIFNSLVEEKRNSFFGGFPPWSNVSLNPYISRRWVKRINRSNLGGNTVVELRQQFICIVKDIFLLLCWQGWRILKRQDENNSVVICKIAHLMRVSMKSTVILFDRWATASLQIFRLLTPTFRGRRLAPFSSAPEMFPNYGLQKYEFFCSRIWENIYQG